MPQNVDSISDFFYFRRMSIISRRQKLSTLYFYSPFKVKRPYQHTVKKPGGLSKIFAKIQAFSETSQWGYSFCVLLNFIDKFFENLPREPLPLYPFPSVHLWKRLNFKWSQFCSVAKNVDIHNYNWTITLSMLICSSRLMQRGNEKVHKCDIFLQTT